MATPPRRIVQGTTYLITRRCADRMFLLRPSAETNDLVLFLLAVLAGRYGVLLHTFCVMSNHVHFVLTDPSGNLPAFMRDLGSAVARALNAAHGDWENFWAPGSYSAVELTTREAILDKMVYSLANPVMAGLVRRGAEWPGLWSAPALIESGAILVKRPEGFFRNNGPLPESASLSLVRPPGFDTAEELRAELEKELRTREDQAASALAKEGRSFLGRRSVLAQKVHARPRPGEPRRGLKPRVAAADKWKRIEALGRLKAFLVAYREAWGAFGRGVRDVVFPEGTYWMRITHGVRCAPST
jgi:putative transposase